MNIFYFYLLSKLYQVKLVYKKNNEINEFNSNPIFESTF